jgi:hypothetical protein
MLHPVISDAALNFIKGVFPIPEIKSFCNVVHYYDFVSLSGVIP